MSDRERSISPRNGSRNHTSKEGKPPRLSRSRSRTPLKSHKKYTGSVSPDGYRARYRSRSRSGSGGRGGYHRGGSRGRYSYSRSRSRSYSPRGHNYRRSHSRSPMSTRRRHVGDRERLAGDQQEHPRTQPYGKYDQQHSSQPPTTTKSVQRRPRHRESQDNPSQSRCLGVFGLSIYTTEQQINHIFSKYGPVERVQVVIDAKTGRSRGFCFVYFESSEDAKVAKDECTGMEIDGRRIRVDYSITQRAHTPTPGVYMGKATFFNRDRGYQDDRRRDRDSGSRGYYRSEYRRRSPSSYYRGGGGDRGGYRRSRYERSRSRSYSPRRY